MVFTHVFCACEGIQAIDVILSARHIDGPKAQQEGIALPGSLSLPLSLSLSVHMANFVSVCLMLLYVYNQWCP